MKLFGLLAAVSAERTFSGNVVYRLEGISQETIGFGYYSLLSKVLLYIDY